MENWSFKDWLESLAYVVAIVGPIIGGVAYLAAYLIGRRNRDITALTTALARACGPMKVTVSRTSRSSFTSTWSSLRVISSDR